jgi:hypothetical protein
MNVLQYPFSMKYLRFFCGVDLGSGLCVAAPHNHLLTVSEDHASIFRVERKLRQHVPLKQWYKIHGATTQMTTI